MADISVEEARKRLLGVIELQRAQREAIVNQNDNNEINKSAKVVVTVDRNELISQQLAMLQTTLDRIDARDAELANVELLMIEAIQKYLNAH